MQGERRTTKELILKVLSETDIADDASIEDALDKLYVLCKIMRGIDDADAGRLISHEEVVRRAATWDL